MPNRDEMKLLLRLYAFVMACTVAIAFIRYKEEELEE